MKNFMRVVTNYIEHNLSDGGIDDLKKFSSFLQSLDYKFTVDELRIVVKNEKLSQILKNVSENNVNVLAIDDVMMLLIDIYDDKADEQRDIISRIQHGDKKARKQFILENQGMVNMVALKYVGRGLDFDDLIQEGNIGLIEAINRFDTEKGFKFSTYAMWWIRCEVRKAVLNQGKCIRVPIHIEEKMVKYREAREVLTQKNKREPELKEIALYMGISISELQLMLKSDYNLISLDSPVNDDGDTSLQEILSSGEDTPEDKYIQKELKQIINELIDNCNLNNQQKTVLIMRYGIDGSGEKTLEEVAKMLGLSRERIRQVESSALRKIRLSKEREKIIEYADNPDRVKQYFKKYSGR